MKDKKEKWILIRNGVVKNIFENRREAIKYFKQLLKQTLKDVSRQDKTDEYDYRIVIPEITIKVVEERESYLGL